MKGRFKIHISGIIRALVIASLVFAQIGLIVFVTSLIQEYAVFFYFSIEVLSFVVILTLVNSSLSNSYKIAWISIVLMLPMTGHIMFWLWGKSDSKKKIEKKVLRKLKHGNTFLEFNKDNEKLVEDKHVYSSKVSKYLVKEGFPVYKNNKVSYFPFGETAFESIFKDIKEAKEYIMINFYIVAEGAIWDRMHELLLEKISEGVKVMFMYDDFGAMFRTSNDFDKKLISEGFDVRVFNPIHKYVDKLYLNYRSHQKNIVIDGVIGYTGGINLADEYANLIRRFGVWKDTAIRIEGDAVWGLAVTFLKMWEVCSKGELIDYSPFKRTASDLTVNDTCLQVVSDGPANHPHNPIESMYRQLIESSRKYCYITTPYLLLENAMTDALCESAKAGVDVRIITPNIPDKKYVKLLTNYNYGKLLNSGVKIFEYTPGFIHAKMILNEESACVGTINMDFRSFYLHYECGVLIIDNNEIKPIYDDFLKIFDESREVTYEEWTKRPLFHKMVQPLLYLFSPLM